MASQSLVIRLSAVCVSRSFSKNLNDTRPFNALGVNVLVLPEDPEPSNLLLSDLLYCFLVSTWTFGQWTATWVLCVLTTLAHSPQCWPWSKAQTTWSVFFSLVYSSLTDLLSLHAETLARPFCKPITEQWLRTLDFPSSVHITFHFLSILHTMLHCYSRQ